MAAVPPSKNTAKIVEEFIRYAQQHLSTVSGLINTVSVFPSAPSPITLPSIVNWTGYFVAPAPPSAELGKPGDSELNEVEENEIINQTQIQKELLTKDLNEANEILASGLLNSQLEEDLVQGYVSNIEEQLENPEIISESLRELKKQKKATIVSDDIYANSGTNVTSTERSTISAIGSIFTDEDTSLTQHYPKLPKSKNLDLIEKALIKIGITNIAIIKAVKANALKESQATPIAENMKYGGTSNERIKSIFGDRAKKYTDAQLNEIKKSEVSMGELMYGPDSGKIGQGLGNTQKGDGFRFRGRGFIQLTGRANYTACSLALYKDTRLVTNPDNVLDAQVAADTCAWYIKRGIPNMSAKTGINAETTQNQLDANLLITSMIAGNSPIKRGGTGFLATESLVKVDKYSAQV